MKKPVRIAVRPEPITQFMRTVVVDKYGKVVFREANYYDMQKIVRAVNHHEDLVEAVRQQLEHLNDSEKFERDVLDNIDAEQAEGGGPC